MARCGCAGGTCSCVITGGGGIVVEGAGTETNPYVISGGGGGGGGGVLTVQDTDTIDMQLAGTGTADNPYTLSANATVELGDLLDVNVDSPTDGYVLAWNGTTWQPVPPTTAPVGAIAVGDGLLGDGSSEDPLRLDPDATAGFVVPTGSVFPFAGDIPPAGYLLCNGNPVGRAMYADLFDVIGITYGAGNGSSTFNVPNMQGRFALGAGTNPLGAQVGNSTHTHSTPAHTHSLPSHTHSVPSHEHSLGADGRALLSLSNNQVIVRRITVPQWQANWATTVSLGQQRTTRQNTTGLPLAGTTGFAGPWTSGSGGAGTSGSGGTGNTGAASSLPPSLALNYIIKT